MSKFDTYNSKWQSKRYPHLILYEEEYLVMKAEFRYIKSFRDEMVNLERWLYANKELTNELPRTKRGWVKQVRNWMRLAELFAEKRYLQSLVKGKVKDLKISPADAGLRLSQIMKRTQAEEAQKAKVRGERSEVKKHAEPVAFGDALKAITK